MKKFMLLAAILALVLVAIAPALAQVGTEVGLEEIESGDAEGTFEVANKGNLVNQCAQGANVTNSGNAVGAAGVTQYQTGTDDIEIAGSTIVVAPEIEAACEQSITVK